jgi:ABC-2 type transport system ATP-binding protein
MMEHWKPDIDGSPQPLEPPPIQIRDLWRSFSGRWGKKTCALKGITLEVHEGEVVGLLGPNGAGKTTTLKILLGMLRPSQGVVRLFGASAWDPQARRRLGFLTEQPYFYDTLTAREFLDLCGVLCGLSRADRARRSEELLEQVGLSRSAGERLRRFSKGMLQRLGLAQALIHAPSLVILDEPMSGLDPLGRSLVRDVILSLKKEGVTVLFSSHILPDVETLCDRVAILSQGSLVAQGTVADFAAAADPGFEIVAQGVHPLLLDALTLRGNSARWAGEKVIIDTPHRMAMNLAVGEILGSGAEIIGVSPKRSPLEEHFLSAVQGLGEAAPAARRVA